MKTLAITVLLFFIVVMGSMAQGDIGGLDHSEPTPTRSPEGTCFERLEIRSSAISAQSLAGSNLLKECGRLISFHRENEDFFDTVTNDRGQTVTHWRTKSSVSWKHTWCVSNPISRERTGSCATGIMWDCKFLDDTGISCPKILTTDSKITAINLDRVRTYPIYRHGLPLGKDRHTGNIIREVILRGQLPVGFGEFENLILLNLSNQELTGTLPSDLGDLANLQRLVIENAHLTGQIPSTFSRLTSLRQLDLSGNDLTGTLPAGIAGAANSVNHLHKLDIADNRFSGAFPTLLGRFGALNHVDLSGNAFSGSLDNITATFPAGSAVEYLNLSDNSFTGRIPAGLKTLGRLKELYLGDNQFDGCLPLDWQNWAVLKDRADMKNARGGALPDCTEDKAGAAVRQSLYLPLVMK